MARLIERAFAPNRPVVARRFFVGAGRHYNPGDAFDWRRLAVSQRRVKALFDAGKLMHVDADIAPEQAEKPAMTPAPSIEQEVQDQEILAIAAAPEPATEPANEDGLDDLNMKELRAIADAEGVPYRLSRSDQRGSIREHRRGKK